MPAAPMLIMVPGKDGWPPAAKIVAALGLFGASTWIGILIGYALWGIVVGLLLAGLAWYAPKLVEAVASALTSLR